MQACGAKYRIQEEYLDETDVDDVVVALVNMARKVSSVINYIYLFHGYCLGLFSAVRKFFHLNLYICQV